MSKDRYNLSEKEQEKKKKKKNIVGRRKQKRKSAKCIWNRMWESFAGMKGSCSRRQERKSGPKTCIPDFILF